MMYMYIGITRIFNRSVVISIPITMMADLRR